MTSTDERRLREGWRRVPFCALLTAEEAVSRLRDAGFSGDVVLEPLPAEDAWVDGPPGRVTDTWPHGPRVAPPDTRVVFYVNPGPAAPLAPHHQEGRDESLQVWEVDGLLPAVDDRPHLFFECLGPRDAPVPVHVQHDIEAPELAFASIGELVALVVELLDAGAWSVEADGPWLRDDDRVPERLRERAVW